MYSKYFENLAINGSVMRTKALKLFEIGLGCNMEYGPGKSARLWRGYLPNANIWFAEYDKACILAHKSRLGKLNVHVVSGDQANVTDLNRWVQETGGNFDVIIDDGGHQNRQIYNSFTVLFQKALLPGGLYFIEDMHCSRARRSGRKWNRCMIGHEDGPSIIDVVKDWVEQLLTWTTKNYEQDRQLSYVPKHRLPPDIKSIECFVEACAITKCLSTDETCPYRSTM